ncbi:hypothetical protein Tco_0513221 [Tanacetum coccineum]
MAKQLRIFQTGGMIRLFINLSCIYKMFRSKSSLKQLTNKTIQKNASLNGQSSRSEPSLSQHVVHDLPSSSQMLELEDDENEQKVSDVEIIVKSRLDEANNIGVDEAHELKYTEDQILHALDLVDAPSKVYDHQGSKIQTLLRAFVFFWRLRGSKRHKPLTGLDVEEDEKLKVQTKKVEELENTVGGFRDELKHFQTMFQGVCGSSDMFFLTQAVSHEGYTGYGLSRPPPPSFCSCFADATFFCRLTLVHIFGFPGLIELQMNSLSSLEICKRADNMVFRNLKVILRGRSMVAVGARHIRRGLATDLATTPPPLAIAQKSTISP